RSVCTLALDRPERSVRRVQQPNVRTALSKMVALPWYAWQPPCQALSFPWETRHDTGVVARKCLMQGKFIVVRKRRIAPERISARAPPTRAFRRTLRSGNAR